MYLNNLGLWVESLFSVVCAGRRYRSTNFYDWSPNAWPNCASSKMHPPPHRFSSRIHRVSSQSICSPLPNTDTRRLPLLLYRIYLTQTRNLVSNLYQLLIVSFQYKYSIPRSKNWHCPYPPRELQSSDRNQLCHRVKNETICAVLRALPIVVEPYPIAL